MNQGALDFTAARERRDVGIACATDHADRVIPSWRDKALAFVTEFARTAREPFLTENVVAASKAQGFEQPPDARAWGGPMRRAANAGVIRACGTGKAATSNLSPKVLWESVR